MLILYSDWSDFRNMDNADAYDQNIAWLASRPWIELVGPDQVADGQIDLSIPPDGVGDTFASLERGTVAFGRKLGPLWIDHAAEGNYDFWWFGSAQERSLRDHVFEIRPGVPVDRGAADSFYGVQSFGGSGSGIAMDAWNSVAGLPDTALGRVGRGSYHASTFLAGWHDEDNSDLRTYSTGAFISPDSSFDELAGFAKGEDLKYFLKTICDIEYIHLPELAPDKEILDTFKKKNIQSKKIRITHNIKNRKNVKQIIGFM